MGKDELLHYFNRIKVRVYDRKILIILLSMTLLIDAITGIMINNLGVKRSIIGVLFRGILLIYFLIYLLIRNKKNIYICLFVNIYIFTNILLSYFMRHFTIKGLLFDIVEIAKIALMPVILIGIISMWKDKILKYEDLKKVIKISIDILLVIYLIGIVFGLGGNIYSGAGYKSVFNANNSFNIVVIVLFIFQTEAAFKSRRKIDALKSFMLILILIFLGSKTSIIFIPFYFILKAIIEFKNLSKKTLLKCIVFTLLICFTLFTIFNERIIAIINNQLYFLNKESESIITFILSGRNEFLSISYNEFVSNISLLSLFFGVGSYFNQYMISLKLGFPTIKNIEMDFFDILFSYGIIGILLTYGVVTYIIIKNIKKIIKNKLTSEIIAISSMILFSFLAGHVFPDAMSATYLAILVAMIRMNGDGDSEYSNFTFRRS